MTLRKRYLRNLKNNKSFYICTVLLTAFIGMLYLGFAANASKLQKELTNYYEDNHIEDAQFMSVYDIDEEGIEELEKKFDIVLEKQKYIDYENEGKTIRLLSNTKKLNKVIIANGKDINSDSDIIISTGYVQTNEIKTGENIKIFDKTYTLTGDMERPDYLFMIKETTDTFAIRDKFGIGIVSDEAFAEIEDEKGLTGSYISIIYNKDNIDEVRKYINEKYHMISYLKADSNTRITTPPLEIEETVNMFNIIVVVFVIFIAVVIAVVLGRKIKGERKQIGVLLALGYKKKEIARHYTFYGFLVAFIGSIIAVITSLLFAEYLIKYLFYKIEPIPAKYPLDIKDVVIAFAFPMIIYVIAVYISAFRAMNTDIITMISGRRKGKKGRLLRLKKSKLGISPKYRIRQIFGKPGRSLIVIVGIAFGGMLYAFCATCIDSMDVYVKNTVDQIGDFEYEYFLNTMLEGKPDEGDPILGNTFEVKDREDAIMLLGIENEKQINFNDNEGNKLTFDKDKYYITSMAALAFDVKENEEITFVDNISLKEYTVKIDKILKNDSQSAIYCSRANAAKLFNLPSDSYNIIMSDKELELDEDILVKTISKESLADQINEVKKGMEDMIGIINIFAIFISIIIVYMMVSVLISESGGTISMLKVLGYKDKEINKIVINVYHFLIPIPIIISLLLGFYGTKVVFNANVSVYKTYLATYIYPLSVVKMVLLVVISYIVSLFLLRGKTKKIDLVESLKDNRE